MKDDGWVSVLWATRWRLESLFFAGPILVSFVGFVVLAYMPLSLIVTFLLVCLLALALFFAESRRSGGTAF